MTSPSTAVANVDNGAVARIGAYRGEWAALLPSHIRPEVFVRVAQGALRRDPALLAIAERNVGSLMSVLMDAARLGLEPGTEQYYLVAFGNEIQGIPGYQGEIELMYRAGAVSSVIVEAVRAKDVFRYSPGRDLRPVHEIDWDTDDRGPLRLAYAYAVMKDGATSKVVVINRQRIDEAKKKSRGSDKASSPWQRNEEAMWLKTAAHQLAKWVPTSAEYLREQLRARAETTSPAATEPARPPAPQAAPPAGVDPDTGEVVDAELVEPSAWPPVAPVGDQR